MEKDEVVIDLRKREIEYSYQPTWCIDVNNSLFFIRNSGKVCVTHNSNIGYHFIISNGLTDRTQKIPWASCIGSVESGRPLNDDTEQTYDEIGAHTFGFNTGSVGICIIGKHSFTEHQFIHLRYLIGELQRKLKIPHHEVYGHYEAGKIDQKYATPKTCPNFPMDPFRSFLHGDMQLQPFMKVTREYIDKIVLKK